MAQVKNRELSGGSDGEPELFGAHPFFHADTKAIRLVGKNTYGVRLLPAFDRSLTPGTDEFKLSALPYRDRDNVDPSSGHPKFTDFYFVVKGYNFLGNDKGSYISPLTLERRDARGVDPLHDIHYTAAASQNPDWKRLSEKPTNFKDDGYSAIIPKYKRFTIANAIVEIEKTGQIENRLVVFGSACLDMLKLELNKYRPAIVKEVADPDWDSYLFGDVTHPLYGTWATVKKTVFNTTSGMSDAGFHFSLKADTLNGRTAYPLEGDWGSDMLKGRYDIKDLEKVTRIWTAEEILDFIVADGFVPYELIQEACGNRWTIPAESTHPSFHPQSAQDADDGGLAPAAVPARPAAVPARPVAPVTRVAAPAAAPVQPARPAAPVAQARPAAPVAAPARPAAPAAARPASPGGMPPKPAATPARPATAAPGAAPRPAAPGVQRPAPGAAAKLPAKVAAPVTPAAPEPEPTPEPAPEPEVDPAAVAPCDTVQPLSDDEIAEFNGLVERFNADTNSLSGPEVQRFAELSDRVSANQQ
jgi:hypothetical protein